MDHTTHAPEGRVGSRATHERAALARFHAAPRHRCSSSSGCPGKDNAEVKAPAAEAGMDDALALLPGNAIAAGTVDARAFFSSPTFGADLAKLVEKYVPIGAGGGLPGLA